MQEKFAVSPMDASRANGIRWVLVARHFHGPGPSDGNARRYGVDSEADLNSLSRDKGIGGNSRKGSRIVTVSLSDYNCHVT